MSLSQDLASCFFLTYTGNTFRKVYETIKNTAETTCHIIMPNPSLYRKVITTAALGNLKEMRALNKLNIVTFIPNTLCLLMYII